MKMMTRLGVLLALLAVAGCGPWYGRPGWDHGGHRGGWHDGWRGGGWHHR
jgi:hypothetical protein